eukprot:TRINITY_DN1613_c0_g2_i1.p1 TRINITY_DN1613_c0_g2~~TRINITY_DN1613_c0_g2_i1.p1  ORF type:complete len:806 (+),score=355.47 TRINITY_DN1613_c0_g2_i1:24-2420(+)
MQAKIITQLFIFYLLLQFIFCQNSINNKPTQLGQSTLFEFQTTGNFDYELTWDFGDGSPLFSSRETSVSHEYSRIGLFFVSATSNQQNLTIVTTSIATIYDCNNVETDELTIVISGVHQIFSPLFFTACYNGLNIEEFSNTVFEWKFNDQTDNEFGILVSHSFLQEGKFQIDLTTSTENSTLQISTFVEIFDCDMNFASNDGPIQLGQAIVFSACMKDLSAIDDLSYEWSFGDGFKQSLLNTPTISHVYLHTGIFNANVTIIPENNDDDDNDDDDTTETFLQQSTAIVFDCSSIEQNEYPKALASGFMLPGSQITFTACIEDYKNKNNTYTWDFGDESTSSGLLALHSYKTIGQFEVTVTINNNNNNDQSIVLRTLVNITSCEIASNDGPTPLGSPTFMVACLPNDLHDADFLFTWDFGDASPKITTNNASIFHHYSRFGNFIVHISVTSKETESSTKKLKRDHPILLNQTTLVTVFDCSSVAQELMPVGITTSNSSSVGSVVTFTACVVDFKNPENRYFWNFGDGSILKRATAEGLLVTHTYQKKGSYSATLTIQTPSGNSQRIVGVEVVHCEGAINDGPTQLSDKTILTACIPDEDLDANIQYAYQWTYGDETDIGSKQQSALHTYSKIGVYHAQAILTSSSRTITQKTNVTIFDCHPAGVNLPSAINDGPKELDEVITLTACIANYKNQSLKFIWDFGDNSTFTQGLLQTHTYKEQGNYKANVRIVNPDGSSIILSTEVEIKDTAKISTIIIVVIVTVVLLIAIVIVAIAAVMHSRSKAKRKLEEDANAEKLLGI